MIAIKSTNLYESKGQQVKHAIQPVISIITVVFNGEEYIEETILSISTQKHSDIEYIIIDGGSSDGTIDIIAKYNNVIDCWISEPDKGVYDAMNKGVSLANGQYVSFLNASDMYYPDSLNMIIESLKSDDFDYSVAPVDILSSSGSQLFTLYPIENFVYKKGSYMQMPAPHLSVFLKRKLFQDLGGYDLSFPLSADLDLLLRLAEKSNNVITIKKPIGAFKLGGISGSYGTYIDNFKVMKKHQLHWFINCQKTLFYLIKWCISLILPRNLIKKLR